MTAGLATGGFTGEFGWFKWMQSAIIHQNAAPVTTAKPTITATGNYAIYLSNDNGSTWEACTSGTINTFDSSSSTDKVLWKIIGAPGTEITRVEVEINAT